MKHKVSIYTLALLGALALAALAGGLFPSDNAVYAANPTFALVRDTDCTTGDRCIPENTPPGVNIGAPISATDDDETGEDALEFGNTLIYKLGGTDAASFDIDPDTGQLITKAALDYNEDGSGNTYVVTVNATDPSDSSDTVTVVILVDDILEPPAAPAPPTVVSGAADSTTTLKVIWHAPENTGPAITGYVVQYKKSTDTTFVIDNVVTQTDTDTVATITDLEADTSYQVRVRATNAESQNSDDVEIAPWSLVGTGSTNKAGNGEPSFDETGDGTEETLTRSVDENELAGEDVDHEVRANAHVDDNTLIYRLGGPDADLFTIDGNGQIKQRSSLNHEDPRCYVENDPNDPGDTDCFYYVTVAVFDGVGGSDSRPVKIEVDDRSEAPDAPARPTVQPTVRGTQKDSRSLDVRWSEPNNPGPPITGYEIRYRKGTSGSYTTIMEGDISGTSHTIAPEDDDLSDGDDRLTPGASYEVHVKAKTNERDSAWSALATGRTSARNREPVFDDRPDQEAAKTPRTIERAVDENTGSGQAVGTAVRARNPGGSLTYKLVAADAPNRDDLNKFDINESTGQILTKEPLNTEAVCSSTDSSLTGGHQENCTYTVKVEVRDGLDEHGNEEESETEADDIITVRILVRDVLEAPEAPTVTVTSPEVATGATEATLVVTWDMPGNTGPDLTGYVVECTGPGITSTNPCPQPDSDDISDPTAETQEYTIEGLTPGSPYRVRVRADNDEREGAWSDWESQSTSEAGNLIPNVTPPDTTPEVAENNRAGSNVGDDTVTANDPDSTLSMTYSVEGPNEDLFTIDGNGQIKTRSSLNHEDPRCYDATALNNCEYSVRVKVADPNHGSRYIDVTIKVTDEEEPPEAPTTPTVTATADTGRSLEVTWNAPVNIGPPITGYEIAYRKYRQGTNNDQFADWPHTGTETKATITTIPDADNDPVPLEPRTQYEVRVRATNGEGTIATDETEAWGDWSDSGRGTTGASNERPVFKDTDSLVTLEMEENKPAGQNVGSAVEATDADRNSLTYSLSGPGAPSFDINRSTGQIRTKSGVTYDYESRQSYSVTVKVDDGQRKDNSVATKSVTIKLSDRDEPPHTPAAPSVMAIPDSTDSVRVMWNEPDNDGPPINDYDVNCDNCPEDLSHDGADRSMIITGLTPGTRYEVEVRARNDEGHSDWSPHGTGSPNPDVTNQVPIFSGGARTIEVVEHTVAAGDPIGSPVSAVDPDLETVTHTLEGPDATSFTIDAGNGQIRATAALDHEEKSSYSVTVRATDTRGGSATVGVTITVINVIEPPYTPSAPTVTAASSTSLQVRWDEPGNLGPPITDYDYRYRETSRSWTEVTNTAITSTMVTIPGLTADTSYDVQVLATNAEGTSGWSNSGFGRTNPPGANTRPVFREGASATRSVIVNAAPNSPIGLPVTATDADPGDTLTYSLAGADAASFNINTANGQLLTKVGVALSAGTTYTVVVVASDGIAEAMITVTVTISVVTNNPPTFSTTTSSRSVPENTPAGQNVGVVVSATDLDSGDTLTYTLGGADASSFDIVSTTGQIRTKSALDEETKSRYTVTVTATDLSNASAAITVTIIITDVTFGCATDGAVADPSNSGLVSDCEALLEARDKLEGSARLDWSVVTPIEDWKGIRMNGKYPSLEGTPMRVTRLFLHGSGLSGTIPPELGDLTELKWLYLHRNDLTGGIPGALNNLSKLQRLYLYDNDLTAISGELGSGMVELKRLFAQRNRISGSIPPALGNMPKLDWLRLDRNRMTGAIPSELGNLSTLRRLYIHENKNSNSVGFSGGIPSTFSNLSRLEYLVLHRTGLNGAIPTWLGGLSNLKWLGLYDNGFTGSIPPQLGSLSNLERLYLHGNQLTGSVPNQLGNLSNLTNLWLKNNRLSGSIPEQLGQLELNRLRLSGSGLTACVPEGLVPTRTLYKSDGTEIPPTDDIEEAGLTVCGSGN